MKDIVIIANFVAELDGCANSRFTYLANLLNKDNKIEIIASDFSHGHKRVRNLDESRFPYKITLVHEPGYPKNVCLERFKSHKTWGINVYKYLLKRKKPDVIYCAVPSLTAASKAAKYCEKNNIKFIIDIQDLWPEAFQMVFNIPIISSIVFAPFRHLADRVYGAADKIIGVSNTYVQRAVSVNKKCIDGMTIYLGTERKLFDSYVSEKTIKGDYLKIAYIGTLGNSYDINTIIDAISLLDQNLHVKLIVMGDGPLREVFEKRAREKSICAYFTGRLPYTQMVAELSKCDIAVNPIKKGSAGSIINKVCDYAMAGLPVVNTQESQEYRNLLDQYHAGINCICEDVISVANALNKLIIDDKLRKTMGKCSRKLGVEKFDREQTYQLIINELVVK